MKLTDESVKEFAEIYQAEFGEELSLKEAESMGVELLEFYALITPTL